MKLCSMNSFCLISYRLILVTSIISNSNKSIKRKLCVYVTMGSKEIWLSFKNKFDQIILFQYLNTCPKFVEMSYK